MEKIESKNIMEVSIPNKLNIEKFTGEFNAITYDIYFERFGRDMIIDTLQSINLYGTFGRQLSYRILWSMFRTYNKDFVEFNEWILCLEDTLKDFDELGGWGEQVTSLMFNKLELWTNENSKNRS